VLNSTSLLALQHLVSQAFFSCSVMQSAAQHLYRFVWSIGLLVAGKMLRCALHDDL